MLCWSRGAMPPSCKDNSPATLRSPTFLPVAYKTDPAELTAASKQGTCYARVEQRQDKQLVKTVGHVMEQREKNVPVVCGKSETST